ncbi:MAG: tRNA epoxyqueuosine(34) reductase QueG [Gammaproteobacteria bacterium]
MSHDQLPINPNCVVDDSLGPLVARIKRWADELGFDAVGIADVDLSAEEPHFERWLANGFGADMDYMSRHGTKRSRPAELIPGTVRVISARLSYLPEHMPAALDQLDAPERAYVSRYALGRDYHKVLRTRLRDLGRRLETAVGEMGGRVFVDSAPVLEKALARNAGLGWIGKHSNLINKDQGSWFFLGEIFTTLPLPVDTPATNHCGTCTACMDVCPTAAIVGPYEVDARLCISYLTIENKGAIPESLRGMMGNRIYGCDDCQLFCPWNKFAQLTQEEDFAPRHELDTADLVSLFAWSAEDFDERTRGSAIRRTGYTGWRRNIAVALGNAPTTTAVIAALTSRRDDPDPMVREHVHWALNQHQVILPTSHTGNADHD